MYNDLMDKKSIIPSNIWLALIFEILQRRSNTSKSGTHVGIYFIRRDRTTGLLNVLIGDTFDIFI